MTNSSQAPAARHPVHRRQGAWHPLLDGDLRRQALEVIADVADSLREWSQASVGAAERSLADGALGLAILFNYLSQTGSDPSDAARAATLLDRAVRRAADNEVSPGLYVGLAGVGWVAAHLHLPGSEGITDEIDKTLAEHVSDSPWTQEYDLIDGLVGIGVYALERLTQEADAARHARVMLEQAIARLDETAERRSDGITWWTDPDWLPDETRATYPRGYYNIGLAHGVPGVVVLLGRACTAGVAEDRARPLLDGAVRWLLAQRLPGGFPTWIAPDVPPVPARLAWCYGDPGVAVALLWAARCVGEPSWEREALAIARRAAERPAEKAGVVDAGLCHGAAGLGHLFNRLFQETGEADFAPAARFWFERTLALRQPDRGVAGYAAWMPEFDGIQAGWVDDPGLLTGAAGIALALLAAAAPVEPEWDRVLLASVPPVS